MFLSGLRENAVIENFPIVAISNMTKPEFLCINLHDLLH